MGSLDYTGEGCRINPHQDPVSKVIGALRRQGFGPTPTSLNTWEARCPCHDGAGRDLSVRCHGDGSVLPRCRNSPPCPTGEIVKALGLGLGDLFVPLLQTEELPALDV